MKRIMILGAGRGQVGLIKAGKKLGYETVVASPIGDYPGLDIADIVADIDIRDEEAILAAADEYGVEGAVTACIDTGLMALGNLCEKRGMPGLSKRAASLSVNKLQMKEVFAENGVNSAKHVKVTCESDLDKALETLRMPLIVKAVDLAGSKGIYTVSEASQLKACYEKTMEETSKDYCIVEEFIEGYKFGVTAMVVNGEILFILPCGDVTVESATVVPIGHFVPVDLEESVAKEVEVQVTKAIRAMGLDNCAVNADLISRDGEIYIVELTGRLGANCLPELTSIYYGADINEIIIKTAMGSFDREKDFPDAGENVPCYGQMIISDRSGIIKSIENRNGGNDRVADVTFFAGEGSEVNKFTTTKDCLGQVVVTGEDIDDCRIEMDKAMKNIEIELE